MIIGRIIKDFPYPTKICPYCFKELKIVNAVHWEEDPYQYKALYLDPNPECPVYDEGAKKAYARIVYSSEDAAAYFWRVQIPVQRWEQADVVSIYE